MLASAFGIALGRPYTFVVMALLILIFGPLGRDPHADRHLPRNRHPGDRAWSGTIPACRRTRWRAGSIATTSACSTTTVNDIEHIESQSLPGIGIVKIFFQPNVDIRTANAQVTSVSPDRAQQMPPGITPPLILNYNASTVPILQLALSGKALSEQQVFDLSQNFIRPPLATVPGAAIPFPYGGKFRQIQIDLDPQALQAHGLSAHDVRNALATRTRSSRPAPSRSARSNTCVQLNNAAEPIEELNNLPIKTRSTAPPSIMRDVAHVRDGTPPQTQHRACRWRARRAAAPCSRTARPPPSTSSTASRSRCRELQKCRCRDLSRSTVLSDQSLFVKAAIAAWCAKASSPPP